MNFMKKGHKLVPLASILFCLKIGICYSQQLPIKPVQTISFETTEGSFMNVDISPDGKIIVFDLLGDIYIVPADGGRAIQLTRGLAYNRCPVWSPDGKQIAFVSDASGTNRLCVMNADGTQQRTLDLSSNEIRTAYPREIEAMPAWTPDSKYIAIDRYLYHLAGGRLPLKSTSNSNVQFSENGQFLYYYEDSNNERNLQRYNRSVGEVSKLASFSSFDPYASDCVSPDGLWLAYVTGSDPVSNLRLRNLATGEDRLLIDSIEGHHRFFKERYSFTPNSRSILIGFGGKIHKIDIQSGADRIIPFSAQVNVDIGPFNYHTYQLNYDSFQVHFTRSANASPDGKTLVFSALSRLYIMALPNGKPHPLAGQPFGQFQPVFSPDGKWIVYVSWSDTKGGGIWQVPATGGKPERITREEGYYMNPVWSPDGRRLAVLRDTLPAEMHGPYGSSLGELEVIDINNKVSHKVADSIPLWNHLSFSPDGTSLTAMLSGGYKKTIILESLSLDGKKKRILAIRGDKELVTTGFLGMQQVTISPDNRYIVYEINEDLYLSPLPRLGNAVTINSNKGIYPVIRFASGGVDPNWEREGKILSWSYRNHFYRINPDKIIEIAIESARDSARMGLTDNGIMQLKVVPDETVDMNINADKEYAHGSIALQNVRIISMKGDEVIENGTIVITDGRIAAVGSKTKVRIPVSAKKLDLRGKTIIPGIIDLHDHCSNSQGVFVQQSWKYLANLAYGVTTARDPAASYDAFGYAELLQTGQMIGPRLFGVGYAVGEGFLTINSLSEARETVRKRVELGAIVIKQYQQETRLQRQWLLMACHELGLNMTNEGDYDLRGEMAMMKDGSTGVEHSYDWSNIYHDAISFIAKSGSWHTATLQVTTNAGAYFSNLYRQNPDMKLRRFWLSNRYDRLMRPLRQPHDTIRPDFVYASSIEAAIFKQGGHIGLGAHGNDPGIGSHWELWALQMGGLTNLEALKVATLSGAEALGLQKDLGSLEPGKIADLIVLEKNPLNDIHNTLSIDYVMKDGILYDGNTLNTMWPIKKRLPEWRSRNKGSTSISSLPPIPIGMGVQLESDNDFE